MSSSTPPASTSACTSASTSKAKLASSSLLALKAEITRKTATSTTTTTTTSSSSTARSYTRARSDPKPISPWRRSNPGLAARQAKDQILYEADLDQTHTIKTARSNLEQKARLYERIKSVRSKTATRLGWGRRRPKLIRIRSRFRLNRKRKHVGSDHHKLSHLLVDFEAKDGQTESEGEHEHSSEEQDSDQAEAGQDPLNPIVEYVDEFGRSHRVPRSDVPAGTALPLHVLSDVPPEHKLYYGDQPHFPVYEPDPEKLAAIARENQRSRGALVDHYDPTKEKRTRGAGFIALGIDNDTRRERMDSLNEIRREAVQAREALESVGGVKGKREADKEERKRMLRHKRDELQAKRKKLTDG